MMPAKVKHVLPASKEVYKRSVAMPQLQFLYITKIGLEAPLHATADTL